MPERGRDRWPFDFRHAVLAARIRSGLSVQARLSELIARLAARLLPVGGVMPDLQGEVARLGVGVIWNMLGYGTSAVAGIAMNVAIAAFFGARMLGVFNVVAATYIIIGQISAFGIQYSTLYHVSIAHGRQSALRATQAALLTVSLLSLLICGLLLAGTNAFVTDQSIAETFELALFGLFLFPLNKVLLANLGGERRFKALACFSSGRIVLIVLSILVVAFLKLPGEKLGGCLSAAEFLTFIGLLLATRSLSLRRLSAPGLRAWIGKHLRFGSRGVLGGLFFELNSRIDVLVLGYFAGSSAVGVYSVGSALAEGVLQLLFVLRICLDPLLSRMMRDERTAELNALLEAGKRSVYGIMLVVGLIAICTYPLVVPLAFDWAQFSKSWPVFAVLTVGIVAASGYLPFSGILQQGGRPDLQTQLHASVAAFNLCLSLALVPSFGALGAAAAAACAQALHPVILRQLVWRSLGLRV
jgi:O-antigen/teichoic acid export membrane protein